MITWRGASERGRISWMFSRLPRATGPASVSAVDRARPIGSRETSNLFFTLPRIVRERSRRLSRRRTALGVLERDAERVRLLANELPQTRPRQLRSEALIGIIPAD